METNTYAEARNIGAYRDYYSIILTGIKDRTSSIAIRLLEKGLSIEEVYQATGLSKEEHDLKNKNLWNNIITTAEDKNSEMATFVRKVFDERASEIAAKLLRMKIYIDGLYFSVEKISSATRLSIQQIDEIKKNLYN